jgi:hypothetical protein
LFTLEKIQIEDDTIFIERDQPLGYIGENYQRFYIHFINVTKQPNNGFKYKVYGKTKEINIYEFNGTITIKKAEIYLVSDIPNVKQGFIKGEYVFYQDSSKTDSGILKGEFISYFYITSKNEIKYDAITFGADGYENNQFEGTWTNYTLNITKNCNWGDYRIPNSIELDGGAAEFMPNEKYIKNGWLVYKLAYQSIGIPNHEMWINTEKMKWWN